MTIPTHIITTGIVTHYALTRYTKWKETKIRWASAASGLIGAAPDLVALPQTLSGNWGRLYVWTHDITWASLMPQWFMHGLIDWLYHQPGGGWHNYAYALEVVIVLWCLIYLMMRVDFMERWYYIVLDFLVRHKWAVGAVIAGAVCLFILRWFQ